MGTTRDDGSQQAMGVATAGRAGAIAPPASLAGPASAGVCSRALSRSCGVPPPAE